MPPSMNIWRNIGAVAGRGPAIGQPVGAAVAPAGGRGDPWVIPSHTMPISSNGKISPDKAAAIPAHLLPNGLVIKISTAS